MQVNGPNGAIWRAEELRGLYIIYKLHAKHKLPMCEVSIEGHGHVEPKEPPPAEKGPQDDETEKNGKAKKKKGKKGKKGNKGKKHKGDDKDGEKEEEMAEELEMQNTPAAAPPEDPTIYKAQEKSEADARALQKAILVSRSHRATETKR